MPYTAWQQAFNPLIPHGRNYYWKALLFSEFSDEALDIAARHGARKPNPTSYVVFEQFSGAYGRRGKTETAFWHRDARYQIVIGGAWDDPAEQERCIAWARGLHDALAPYALTGRNLNFTVVEQEERTERIRAASGDNYERLVRDQDEVRPEQPLPGQQQHRPGQLAGSHPGRPRPARGRPALCVRSRDAGY